MIEIRHASRFDVETMVDMVERFADVMDHVQAKKGVNCADTKNILEEVLAGKGLALVATYNSIVEGLVVGYIVNNIWNRSILVLHEIIYWVNPDYRGTRMGYLLLKEYAKEAKEWLESGRIHASVLRNMERSNIDYSKFGYEKFQEEWVT